MSLTTHGGTAGLELDECAGCRPSRRRYRGRMVTRTTTSLTDDLDGSRADATVSFVWQGQAYDIDLSQQHAQEFADAIAPYLAVARTSGRGRRRSSAVASGATSGAVAAAGVGEFDPKAVRAWARDNGVEASARGRLSSALLQQYRDAQEPDPAG